MEPTVLEGLLKAISDAVSGRRHADDDVALPVFDPATSDSGAEGWCKSIEELSKEFGWSSITTVAKAGKALKGSALLWFESWVPSKGGRTWENFRTDLADLYPEKRNLSEKLSEAVLYNSDSADSYCEYAREKVRQLRNTKISFTEDQLIELICGSITDVNVRMAAFNSSVKSTSQLISLFSSYVKPKKRPIDQNDSDSITEQSKAKRPKLEIRNNTSKEKKCYSCGKTGHIKIHCNRNRNPPSETVTSTPGNKASNRVTCTFCKKPGHNDSVCWHKARSELEKADTIKKEVNFLGEAN